MDACDQMIEMKGGHETLGLNGYLSQLIMTFRQELYLAKPAAGKGKIKSKR